MAFIGNYESIPNLINDLAGTFKRVDDNTPLNKQDALEWAVDCIRQIGGGVLIEVPAYHIDIVSHRGKLPPDLQQIYGVYRSDGLQPFTRIFPLQYTSGIKSNYLCEDCINLNTVRGDSNFNQFTRLMDSFTINFPYIITNFESGEVCVDYYGINVDSNGIPMYPDTVSVKEAIKAFVLYKWLYEPYLLDEIKGDKFAYLKDQKDYYIQQAKNDFAMPDFLEARKLISNSNKRYSQFKIPRI